MTEPAEPRPIEQRILSYFGRRRAYWGANSALFAFGIAQFVWGYSPLLSPSGGRALNLAEAAVAVVAALALTGMVLHMLGWRGWLARGSYLMLLFSTALTAISFFSAQARDVMGVTQLRPAGVTVISLLLLTGFLVALSMHVEYGGRRTITREEEER